MPLFYYSWKGEEPSLLVDERDEKRARAIATEHAGIAPDAVRELPPATFAAEVHFVEFDIDELSEDERDELTPEDIEEGDEVSIDPLEHVGIAMRKLEDQCVAAFEAKAFAPCGNVCESDTGAMLRCTRARHADDEHTDGSFRW